jgi:hypothetical protein
VGGDTDSSGDAEGEMGGGGVRCGDGDGAVETEEEGWEEREGEEEGE